MLTDIRSLEPAQRAGIELKLALDNALGRVDYKYFVGEILGYERISHDPDNPDAFEQFRDPRVQWHLDAIGGYITDWFKTRGSQESFRKIMDIRPRGTCKSATATIPLPIWAHLNSPEIACAVIGAKHKDIAEDFSKATRSTFEGEDAFSRLTDLYGSFKGGRGRDWQTSKMTTLKRQNLGRSDATYTAYSLGKGATSSHLDLLIIDDPITRETMEGDSEWLNKVWANYTLVPYLLNRNGLLYLVMTRYHEADLCGRIINEEIRPAAIAANDGTLPADFDDPEGWIKYAKLAGWDVRYDKVYEDYDPATKAGKVMYPICWSHEKIMESRKTDLGEAEFHFHLMNSPQGREDQPVKKEHVDKLWLDSIDQVPPQAKHAIDIHCDFSFKNATAFMRQSGDWGVAHVVAKHDGHVYRLNGIRAKLTQEAFGDELMKLVAWVKYDLKSHVRYISYDASTTQGSGDQSTDFWIHELFRAHPDLPRATPKSLDRHAGPGVKKVARILSTVWAWQQGFVHLIRGVSFNDPLIYQMCNIGFTEHDDDRDAFADSFHPEMYMASPVFSENEDVPWETQWKPALQPLADDFDPDWI